MRLRHDADNIPVNVKNAPPKRGISAGKWDAYPRRLNLSSVKEADRQPLVTMGAGGGGCLRGRSAAAAAVSIAKDAAAAVSIFSMM
jgi:hypothetical protein